MFTIRLASSHLPLLAKGYLSAPVPLTYTSPSDKSPACLASIATFPIIPLYAGVSPPSLTICLFLFCITGHTIPCHPDEPMKTVKSCMTNPSLFLRQSNIDALQSIHLVPTANWVRIPTANELRSSLRLRQSERWYSSCSDCQLGPYSERSCSDLPLTMRSMMIPVTIRENPFDH